MKVLHLINTLSAGGAELQLLTLCRYLKRHGIESIVACLREYVQGSRSLRPDFEREGMRVITLRAEGRYDLCFPGRLVGLLRQEQPEILHTHLPRADFAGAVGHLLCPSIPWICSVHDTYNGSWSAEWSLALCSLFWRRADGVIVISHAVKDWLVEERHVPPEKVTLIHYGIEPEGFARRATDLRKTWSLEGRAVVGSIGRLEPRKAHDRLIKAMPALLEQVPNASLLIAGHDPWGYGKDLHALIAELGVEEQVRIVGFQADIASFLGALDVFAFASRSEGFGQVVIEAMAAGKPVVARRIPPLTEIVVDGGTGLLVEPEKPEAFARAVSWLLMHPEEAQHMGMQGRERISSHFSAEKMVAKVMSLYDELARTHYDQKSMA
jgi:glycosyltransferase involved in cell wall biosynthesis